VRAAAHLRDAGFACPVVSLGSTPTALAATRLSGVTDVRAGNFVFFDLVMYASASARWTTSRCPSS
jgi:D-serine deaminase-like pyridoxal phosphate-dependent protein